MPINYTDELRIAYLRAAIAAQQEVESKIAAYRDFFNGEQGIVLTTRQQEYLTGRGDGQVPESFGNICRRVVDVIKDRLALADDGIAPAEPDAGDYAEFVTDWWNAGQLGALQKEIYGAALRDGQTAVIVGWDGERPTYTPNLVYDGETGLVRFHYDNDDNLLYASKRWRAWDTATMTATGKTRLTLYLDDRIERYEEDGREASGWRWLTAAEAGAPNPQPWVDNDGQPLGIPVVPFEAPAGSELADVLTIQKTLNHALGEFDIATDHHNWPILWTAGAEYQLDADGKPEIPSYGHSQLFNLGPDGKMGRIDPPDLERMWRAGVLSWIDLLALVKGWPLHVLNKSQQPPSGVALRVMEGSLLAKIADTQTAFGGAWLQCFELGRRLHRLNTRQELAGELTLTWEPAAVDDPLADIEAKAKKWEAASIPTEQRWREAGYTEKEIRQMQEMTAAAEVRAQESLAQALLQQQRQFEQTGQAL